jgi:hypothetical protein
VSPSHSLSLSLSLSPTGKETVVKRCIDYIFYTPYMKKSLESNKAEQDEAEEIENAVAFDFQQVRVRVRARDRVRVRE